MEGPVIILAVAALGALVVLLPVWHFARSRRLVEDWARANDFELLETNRRFLCRGPFWWRTARSQEVFRVVVRDRQGEVRRGYVRVGGRLAGMLANKVTVEWD